MRPQPRGYRSRVRTVRLPDRLDETLAAFAAVEHRERNVIMRDALTEYFEHHPIAHTANKRPPSNT
ncbi:MAG: ribbon-helix-helix protein, CopG family [Lacisediminihabitans sp.]